MRKKQKGFSLIELIIVLIITSILAQLGFVSFNRYSRKAKAFVAKTALKNIQKECESNRDLRVPETFTLMPIKGYSIYTRNINSCLGQSSDGKVAVIANNQNNIPNFFYDFNLGYISCNYQNLKNNLFKECIDSSSINSKFSSDQFKATIPNKSFASCNTKMEGQQPNDIIKSGKSYYAYDGDLNTRWLCNSPSTSITFDLNKKQPIDYINISLNGGLQSNGNYVKIYVDDKLVAEGTQHIWQTKWDINDIEGKSIRYETVLKDDYRDRQGQKPLWSEIGDININGESAGPPHFDHEYFKEKEKFNPNYVEDIKIYY